MRKDLREVEQESPGGVDGLPTPAKPTFSRRVETFLRLQPLNEFERLEIRVLPRSDLSSAAKHV